jgi:hypothetical protein
MCRLIPPAPSRQTRQCQVKWRPAGATCGTRAAIGRVATAAFFCVSCEAAIAEIILSFHFGMAKGLIVTRISAAAAISICWLVFNPLLAHTQPDQSESKYFPWQELRDGNCVTNGDASE